MATLDRPAVRDPYHLYSDSVYLVPGIYLGYLEEKPCERQLATKLFLIRTSVLPHMY